MRAKWILIGVVVLAVGAGLYWVNDARTYDGLAYGASTIYPEGSERVEGRAVVALRSGGEVRYGVSVYNEGDRTVKVTGVGKADPDTKRRDYQMTPLRVMMTPEVGITDDNLVPFAPVELDPGEEYLFAIYERMPSCRNFTEGGGTGVSAFDVRFESFVFDREVSIPLPEPIDVIKDETCGDA